jgi:hypothetical protein
MELRFAQSARRHRIGKAHVRHVVATTTPTAVETPSGDAALEWIGPDDRYLELEVVGVILEPSDEPLNPNEVLIIHVMPTDLRGEK